MTWPADSDGGVLRRMEANGFDFSNRTRLILSLRAPLGAFD